VLAAETVRGLSAPYVFVCGLSEKAFPPPHREDCLYTDADARRWGASGLPLPSNSDRGRFEMLLFYEVVTRATRHLALSYPALDAQAQALVPSPFLREVEHVCGPTQIPRNTKPHLDCIPPNDAVVSVRDFRIRAVSEALAGREQLFEQLCAHPATSDVARSIVAGLAMTEARDEQAFGSFDGMLTTDAARVKLAERFGPGHCWSPSKLEVYANCPHEFFMKNVLRVRPLDEPELATDFMGRGQMLHWLLAQAHRELNSCQGGPSTPCGNALSDFTTAVERFAAELRRERGAGTLAAGMVEINVRQVLDWLARYQEHHQAYDQLFSDWQQPLRPAHFEVSFGPQREEDGDDERSDLRDPLSSDQPFALECAGEMVQFNGRIDRIDVGRYGSQTAFTVVDYKSGKPKGRTELAAVRAGNSLQLPLYALAAEQLLAEVGAVPFRAAYWHMSGKGYQDKEAVKFRLAEDGRLELSDEWSEMEDALRARIASLVRGVRRGEFPMFSTDDDCTGRCDYATVCRVNQARSREKVWQPPEGGQQ
jgi:ATP-dependent helicase/DNAse subunit B